jgi:hypothetical protein
VYRQHADQVIRGLLERPEEKRRAYQDHIYGQAKGQPEPQPIDTKGASGDLTSDSRSQVLARVLAELTHRFLETFD